MIQELVIPGRLDGMNEYTRACRTHWAKGSKMKKENQEIVLWAIKKARLKPHPGKVRIEYTFYEQPRLRDKSNIASFAIKVIEDALQEAGIIKNDSWHMLSGYSCRFFRATGKGRIEVVISDSD